MKLLTQTGLTELITKIKSSFIKTTDVVEANVLDIDTTPTQSSNNLITSGGVYTSVSGKEDTSNKVTTITSSSTDVQYPTAKLLYDTRQDLKEIAEGKTNSYVVSKATNPAFDTQDASFQLTGTFTDIKGISHNVTDLKLGDNIYVLETDVPDRWCSDPTTEGTITVTLYKLETAKVPVQDVQIGGTTIVNNSIANIPIAATNTTGLMKPGNYFLGGIGFANDGSVQITNATAAWLATRRSDIHSAVTPSNFDDAVRLALTDGVGAAYTDTEQTAARTRLGASAVSVSDTGTSTDEVSYITIDGTEKKIGGGAAWGAITGTLTDQTDLTTALNAKADKSQLDDVLITATAYADAQRTKAIEASIDYTENALTLVDTATSTKYRLVVTNGLLGIQEVSE